MTDTIKIISIDLWADVREVGADFGKGAVRTTGAYLFLVHVMSFALGGDVAVVLATAAGGLCFRNPDAPFFTRTLGHLRELRICRIGS